jgi:uncharacterized protein (TIGR00251 family)
MKLPLKVIPDSSRDCIAGWLDDTLKVRVKAPAEHGKANTAVEKIVANALSVSNKNALIIKGKTSARKIIEITGLSESDVYQKLSESVN